MAKLKPFDFLARYWPGLFILILVLGFFYPVWLKGLVPIPADFIVGVYYPWLDYKWLGYEAGVPVKNPLLADVPSLIYTIRAYAMEVLKTGVLPLWNPLQFGGYPLLATFQSAVLYPLNFLYFLFDTVDAWTIQVVLQPLLAASFTYLLLRHLKLSKLASILGGIIFAFSGFNIIWLEYNVHGHVAAFLPLILLLADKLLETRNLRWGILLSLSIATQVFAGYPQLTLYTLALVFAWFLFKLSKPVFSKVNFEKIVTLGIFGVLGISLAAVQIIPGYELLSFSQRVSEGLDLERAFLPWKQLVTLFAPDYFGNPTTRNFWGPGDYTNTVGYTGVLSLVFASLAVTIKRTKEIIFFLLVALISLILALPTPLTLAFYSSGLLGSTAAAATRILVVFNLATAILAAFGFDRWEKVGLRQLARGFYLPLVVLLGTFLGTFISYRILLTPETVEPILQLIINLRVGLKNLILPIALTSFLAFLLVLASRLKLFISFFKLTIVLLVSFEMFRFGWKYTPFAERGFLFPSTPVFEFLQQQEEPFRMVGGDVIPISMWIPYELESPSGYDAVYPEHWAKIVAVINTGNYEASHMGRYGEVERFDSPLFDLTNTKFLLALKRDKGSPSVEGKPSFSFELDKLTSVFEDKSVSVLENKSVAPRAFFVSQWEELSEEETLEKLLDREFPKEEKIFIHENFDKFDQTQVNKSEVSFTDYGREKMSMAVETDSDGLLFLADSWYPGWKALVDGTEERIYKSNYAFRAVPVSKGVHTVEFIYDPKSFKIGVLTSLLSAIVLMAILFFNRLVKTKK